ncbi:hypothetical protein Cylst_1481 [Cylindrospermum stagnale PCC 7417]|uniref:Pyrroloquinoline quinone (Coenzyme PQQ) biosynthesis protein C n=1 Tax=Cylindrospermum stagnale PCC 7417 TaxID=56107 RepID=K9WTQ1_9NOST|nr:hypothetical protein [Cylindrospermum stagnale]AFZ23765.1 hypothetical protein Cylst_1481 [Cylindrospermum stagnale PCC 7417]
MQELLVYIENKKQEFAQLPLFDFMQDQTINPRQRLSFAPCMAHYVMSFGDLNKYVFPVNLSDNLLQQIVNEYTIEDSNHWQWFLIDLEQLEFNPSWNFTQSLRFIWGEETKITRQIAYQVAAYTLQADPVIRLAVIEALEATGKVFFLISSSIASEIQEITKKKYIYFGNSHLQAENEHAIFTSEIRKLLIEIELTDSQIQKCFDVVDGIFNIFSRWTNELLEYALKHRVELETYQEAQHKLTLLN